MDACLLPYAMQSSACTCTRLQVSWRYTLKGQVAIQVYDHGSATLSGALFNRKACSTGTRQSAHLPGKHTIPSCVVLCMLASRISNKFCIQGLGATNFPESSYDVGSISLQESVGSLIASIRAQAVALAKSQMASRYVALWHVHLEAIS